MKGLLFAVLLLLSLHVKSQRKCETNTYLKEKFSSSPIFKAQSEKIEKFTADYLRAIETGVQPRITNPIIIKIPVVVHVLYHYPEQKIANEIIHEQIAILNRDFRRKNTDTSLTPSYFRPFAADCEIEFQLATSDPRQYSTTGIVKKYTPIKEWASNDKMKFSSELGADAWDTKSYLNIWVCALNGLAGYSVVPGGDLNVDGVVIDFAAFGTNSSNPGFEKGRTLVHEVGHWLNLKHIWGDADCGDDGVSDTPKQDIYTVGCPSGIRTSCNNGPYGNMYMNYMDLTGDECLNMFTKGQKARMNSLFASGGARASLLNSKGLANPVVVIRPIEFPDPTWLFTKIYPNPASDKLIINLEYDQRWVGKTIYLTNITGQNLMQFKISSKVFEADISTLTPGVYFITAQKDDGEFIKHKFIKL